MDPQAIDWEARLAAERLVRVFVSSTFRDMHAEREELTRRVFPLLRKRCEARGVVWSEVDLRWGIPPEKASDVLPICLDEISRCRPFFIGLLGDRYGSVLESVPADLMAREPWLAGHRGASVTELEIRHGFLRHPGLAPYSRFYFRDPSPQEEREDGAVSARLESLKRDIRHCDPSVCQTYRDAGQLGELVLRDFSAIIDKIFPEGSEPVPLARETARHEWFARLRVPVELRPGYFAGVYVGRGDAEARLSGHACGIGPPLVVVGDPGVGKTSFLANWAFRYRESHPDDFVLLHFAGVTPESTDWAAMLGRLLGEIQARFGLEETVPEDEVELREAFARRLAGTAGRGRMVLVLEGVDQLEDRNGAPDLVWLPRQIPEAVRIVLSSRRGRTAAEAQRRGWPSLDLGPLAPGDRRVLVERYLAQWGKELSPSRVARVIAAEQTANPQFLSTMLNELRLFGSHADLDACIGGYLATPTIEHLFRIILQRLEADYERERPGLVGEALSLIGSSRHGLAESELLDLLGSGDAPLPYAHWAQLYAAIEPHLVSRSGRLTFSNDAFRQAVRGQYLKDEPVRRSRHERLAAYFERRELSDRRLEELPWQLSQAGAWRRLYDLLADREFFFVGWSINRSDMKTYWALLEERSTFRMVDAYSPILRYVARDPGDRSAGEIFHIRDVADLLAGAGHHEQALVLRRYLVDYHSGAGQPLLAAIFLNDVALSYRALGRMEEALAALQAKREIERQAGGGPLSDRQKIKTLNQLGLTLTDMGRLDEAQGVLEEQERLARAAADRYGLGACLGNQARLLMLRGRLAEAIGLFEMEEQLCRAEGDMDGLKHAVGNLSLALAASGDADRAEALAAEKEEICRRLGDPEGLANALEIQATIADDKAQRADGLMEEGDFDRALPLLQELERTCRRIGKERGLAHSLDNQGTILRVTGDVDGSLRKHEEAEALFRKLGEEAALAASLGNRGITLRAKGEVVAAMESYVEAEAIWRRLGDQAGLQRLLGNQGNLLLACGDLAGAIRLFEERADICRRIGDEAGLEKALTMLRMVLAQLGRA